MSRRAAQLIRRRILPCYDRLGGGPPVVLLHGWPGSRSDYRLVAPLLADADVVVPDLRGSGGRDKHPVSPDEGYTADAQARSVTGCSTSSVSDQSSWAATTSAAASPQGPGILVRGLAEQAPAPEDRLAVPTHVLWPAHDPLFPPGWGDRLGDFFADVAVTPLPDSGHFVPLEAPDAFASAIRAGLGAD